MRETGDMELLIVASGARGTSLATHVTADKNSRPATARWRRILAAGLLAALVAALRAAPADAKYASIVLDADSGLVRHETNADERLFPASLTKLMTLYLLFEAVESKRISWNTQFTASRRVALQPATRIGLAPGDKITAKEAALALIIQSANDVASLVAEELGDTEEKFALQMTDKARRLGMTRTTFRNASGLPHNGQQSSARDMAILAQALMNRFPQHYPMFSETSFTYGGRVYKTHNRVLLNYDGADGLKTGFTHASGFNLVTSAVRDNHRLIGVVFGSNTSKARDSHMQALLDQAFASIQNGGAAPLMVKNTAPKAKMPSVPVHAITTQVNASKPANGNDDGGDWGIQVGAFQGKDPARTAALQVKQKYAKVLDGGQVVVAPLPKSKGKTLYRARIMGLEKDAAYQACKLLKRAKQACMELKEPAPQEVAETRAN
jgi:D-alanyl-D-alanine carboxypeptidase